MKLPTLLRSLVVTGALVLACAAHAQQPATPPAVTPAQLEAAREVVVLSGISRTFKAFVPQIARQIILTVTRTRPELAKPLEEVLNKIGPEYDKRTDEMIDVTARLFANAMTEKDLKATAEFFKTESGKRYVEMQPKVIDQMVVSLDDWNRKMSDEIFNRVREEMKKKGLDM